MHHRRCHISHRCAPIALHNHRRTAHCRCNSPGSGSRNATWHCGLEDPSGDHDLVQGQIATSSHSKPSVSVDTLNSSWPNGCGGNGKGGGVVCVDCLIMFLPRLPQPARNFRPPDSSLYSTTLSFECRRWSIKLHSYIEKYDLQFLCDALLLLLLPLMSKMNTVKRPAIQSHVEAFKGKNSFT